MQQFLSQRSRKGFKELVRKLIPLAVLLMSTPLSRIVTRNEGWQIILMRFKDKDKDKKSLFKGILTANPFLSLIEEAEEGEDDEGDGQVEGSDNAVT